MFPQQTLLNGAGESIKSSQLALQIVSIGIIQTHSRIRLLWTGFQSLEQNLLNNSQKLMKGAASFEAFGWRQYAIVGARYSVRRSIQVWGSYSTRSTRAKRLWERSFERRRPSAFQRIRSNRLFRPESFVSPVASRPSNRGPRSIQMRCFQCYTLFARSCSSRVSRKMFPKMFCKCFRTVLIRPNGLIIANSVYSQRQPNV